ncbi:glycosyltransferase [Saccharomonospora cyanea]|uniref:Putative glycosyltransferase n=1 Tax=Saccharomonospora cyanea NA-134 TaxID=882082 RepID=H5XQJ5_9PSEU|nr:glycosyltransferase [Saccharomonospora cyanea]EHR59041.1 putative glycosyltransferase [Saccharomonospora cyanea NA-134]
MAGEAVGGSGVGDGRLIEWTGERCVPWVHDYQVIYEHYHRYAFALRFAAGKRVLDLASGEGYGSAMLATTAAEVVGLDIDEATVAHASATYPLGNLRFTVGSITDPEVLADEEPFDVVTCFEAVEHVAEQDELMRLVRARLAPDGVLLCSTPDVAVYTHDHGNENPYHVKELTRDGFRQLLAGTFEHVTLLRQNVAVGSLVHDGPERGDVETHTLNGTPGQGWSVSPGAPHTYLLGVASAVPVEVPRASVLTDPDLTLVAHSRSDEIAELTAAVSTLRASLEHAENNLRGEQAESRRRADERDAALARAADAERRHAEAVGENTDLRERLARHAKRLAWLSDHTGELRRTVGALAAENAKLKAEQSALAQRLISRYRSTVERVAPRGTRLRDAYESALGRPKGVLPTPVEDTSPVGVTTSVDPIVSVVVPVYGNWSYTRRCLASIEANLPDTPFEVIVVDDASPDGSADLVARCPGVRLVRAERNQGFVHSCNLGARHAGGEFVLFLNNDTEVHEGWLDSLVSAFEKHRDIGLAGSKLVYPDGTLQECGGIIWADGTGWNYGRGDNPHEPRYATLRDVDYCSGAAVMVRKSLFDSLGGFDTRYAPAYYEDTDLAFAVRAAGYRTVVQPESVVTHHEGISNGTDVSSGVKRHQELNRAVFVEKWADALAHHRPEASPRNLWLGRNRTSRGHGGGIVLVADHQVPRTDEDSGSVRMSRILDLLVGLDQRVVFFPMNGALPERYTSALYQAGVTVVADAGQRQEFLREAGTELRLAVLSRPQVAWQLLEQVRQYAPDCVVAYDTVDLHFVRLGRQAELAKELGDEPEYVSLSRRAEALRELELGLTRASDVTLTVSDDERRVLAELVPSARVKVLSNIHSASPAPTFPDGRRDVLFVGGFDHVPNRDAARWLAEEIMPLVRREHPAAVAHIVGSKPPREVLDLERDGVVVHGWVEDLAVKYREARVVVAPLRFGAGVKGKVGEALSHGVPVVGTTLALEGMDLRDGESAIVGDTAEQLARGISSVLTDDGLWTRLARAGRTAVEAGFGPDVARSTLSELLTGADPVD